MPDSKQPISDDDARRLVDVAVASRGNSYAPYSDFQTGAAVLAADGSIHRGVLVENLVFGLAMCAERVAMFSAVASGVKQVAALALVAPQTAGRRTYPCGPCLQVAIELGGPDMAIISAGSDDETEYVLRTVDELVPGIPRRGDV